MLARVPEKVVTDPIYLEKDFRTDDALVERVREALVAQRSPRLEVDGVHLGNSDKTVGGQLSIDDELPEACVSGNQYRRSFGVEGELPKEHMTSLSPLCVSMYRPYADGSRGMERMRVKYPVDRVFAALAETLAPRLEVPDAAAQLGSTPGTLSV